MARQKAFVETIEPSEDVLSMEEVVKLFSTAFEYGVRRLTDVRVNLEEVEEQS